MKKIMVLASAIALSCAASAASFVWGFAGNGGEIYAAGTENYLETGTAFLFLGTVTASDSAFDTSAATLVTMGGYDEANYAFGHTITPGMPADSMINADGGQAYTLILVDKDVASLDGYEGNYFLASGESTQGAIPGATVTYYAKFINDQEISGANWSTMQSIPEPTSGLLLLLGMAGLALRRK